MKKIKQILFVLGIATVLVACAEVKPETSANPEGEPIVKEEILEQSSIPEYDGNPYVVLNNNVPQFTPEDLVTQSYEEYSELDSMGKCGVAMVNIGFDLMPTEERGTIGQVKPSGWQTVKYDNVEGKYLYNRCHLIGFQLTGKNANERNLITGTRYMNVEGMLPFENMVADYIKETKNHVLYRVTPIFEGNNLVASGVQMEAMSVEDNGEGICFNVYVYNVQPGIEIDYATGNSKQVEEKQEEIASEGDYILNTNTKKIHRPTCSSAKDTKAENRQEYHGNIENLKQQGYEGCKRCNP